MTLRSTALFLLLTASLHLSAQQAAQQARVNVTGSWQEGRFTLAQNGDSVTSEGDLGHANGHFTGPYTLVMSWRNASLIGTVTPAADRIDWNHNAPWTRQAPGSKVKQTAAPAQ